jgi:hypothetical protein
VRGLETPVNDDDTSIHAAPAGAAFLCIDHVTGIIIEISFQPNPKVSIFGTIVATIFYEGKFTRKGFYI